MILIVNVLKTWHFVGYFFGMLRNYFKIALRNLFRNKVYSFINIAGLATGMAVALLIGLWIWGEISFDHVHLHHDRLARMYDTQIQNGTATTGWGIDVPLTDELRTRYGSDFKHLAMASGTERHILAVNDKKMEKVGIWAQGELPGMLTLHMLEGSSDALKDPSSMLVTASLAKALFGDADPLNKTIQIDDKGALKVGGVYEDLPSNAYFHNADCFLPWDKFLDTHIWVKNTQTQWGSNFVALYVEIGDHSDFGKINERIRHIPAEHMTGSKEEIMLHPMDKWHLYNEFKDGKVAGGNIQFVWLFGTIALFVLLLACINFMNLSTARSERRALEVGIRKTMGSLRGHLIRQFLGESILTAFFALVVALVLTQALLPFFNYLAGERLAMPWGQPLFWLSALVFTVFTGLLSGSYPAFYLSAFQPIRVLKGNFRVGRFATIPRKILVVVQFAVSVILIIGTLIVFRQIQFARSRPLGYDQEGLVTVNILNNPGLKPHFDALRNDLLRSGAVEDAAGSAGSQTYSWASGFVYSWVGEDPHTNPIFNSVATTFDYGNTARWQLVQGRNFSKYLPTDSSALILTESAVKLAGLQHPIGQVFTVNGHRQTVIGVVKDMVIDSPYDPATPMIFFIDCSWINFITIRLKKNMLPSEALSRVHQVFKQYDPEGLATFKNTDEDYAMKFAAEKRIGNIAVFFTVLAIFISCLGLFGLASFVAEQRTREIGVRKVLGATVFDLWSILSKDFLTLVLIACVIAIPVSAYFLHGWLQRYTYRTPVSWWIYVGAVTGAMLITLLTVSYQTIRAALANPARSLRAE